MIKQRLLDICKALGISASEMSTSIGMSRPYIANLKKDITTEVLLNIHTKYPSVNIMRIITGEGDILLDDNKNLNSEINFSFFIEKYNQLESENKKLLLEIGELRGQLKVIKKDVHEESNVICAIASGSDLEK
ncbi:hypothetical protein AAE250_16145 [Bacteroides sp. GD17]|jgi:transcriptional regulator with XRE-family HTH domain|uniref:hypothetical protein n=1 Tax=Bacteroides sp. GD17 TaxID=3139826 RepID=UPI00204CB683|nr:hypothetical protein [uncultured Bacteroides sp.]DAV67244.1 MAG TPA: PUTATIVE TRANSCRIPTION REGULATOR, HTH DNA-BINDING MOTIF [Caudoviricetes sp.]